MTVYWLLQQSADVPEGDDWLSPFEQAVLAKYRAPKRRRDWRLGRWTAKKALVRAGALGDRSLQAPEWSRLSIRANDAGVPRLFVDDADAEWEVSISHSGDWGLAAVARKSATVGCDIETVGRRGEEFVVDWFTEDERALAADTTPEARSSIVTLIWSAKESALKALGVGLRLDTRRVQVRLDPGGAPTEGWRRLVVAAPGRELHGWWKIDADRAITVLADPAPGPPVAV